MLTFLFSALTMTAVGKAAIEMVEEVRRQFREFPGIMDRTQKPDYKRCVEISTHSSLKQMILPGVLAIIVPVAIGLWSVKALWRITCWCSCNRSFNGYNDGKCWWSLG